MKCKYCKAILHENYKYYNHSLVCKICDINYSYGPEEYSISKNIEINDNTYSIIYLSYKDETYLYKEDSLVSSLGGEINPFDIIKRIKTIEVFS